MYLLKDDNMKLIFHYWHNLQKYSERTNTAQSHPNTRLTKSQLRTAFDLWLWMSNTLGPKSCVHFFLPQERTIKITYPLRRAGLQTLQNRPVASIPSWGDEAYFFFLGWLTHWLHWGLNSELGWFSDKLLASHAWVPKFWPQCYPPSPHQKRKRNANPRHQ